MIEATTLVQWVIRNAIGRSYTYPNGFISAEKLAELVEQIKAAEPFNLEFAEEGDTHDE